MELPSESADQQEHASARVAGDALPSELCEHEQRHRRRSSGAESTLAPLPVFLPTKVLPRGNSFGVSFAVGNNVFSDSASTSLSGSVIQDASSLQMDLQAQTANYETILRHFNLRKLPTEHAMIKPHSAVDYSHHPLASMRVRSTASSGSPRHVVSSRAYSPSSRHTPRFSLYRSLKNLKRNAFGSMVSWLRSLHRPMAPTGTTTKLKDFALFWVYCFQLLYLPFAPTYLTSAHEAPMMHINVVLELIYLADMLATFNTAVYTSNHGSLQLISSRKDIAKRYLKDDFALDLLSALPLETVAWLSSATHLATSSQRRALVLSCPALFHIGNMLRFIRWRNFVHAAQCVWITQVARFLELKCRLVWGVYCVLVRTAAKMFVLSLVMAHYSACLWHAIVRSQDTSDSSSNDLNHQSSSPALSSSSIAATYFSDARYVLLIMVGSGSEIGNPFKDAFAIVLLLTGVLFFSFVVGNISMLITTANYSSRVEYERKKQALVSKMAKLQLPHELQERIYRYYEHLWTEYDATHEDITDFTRDLTRPLALEVGLCRYMNLVVRVPFWTDCSPDFVSAVVLNLRVLVFLPDDFIVRKGEIGTEFFMIHRGVGELASFHRETVRLTNGASFGEVALLLNCKRATSVRALTYMEICVLPRKPFQEILARYHNDRRRVILRILRRGLESSEHPQLWQEVLLRKAHEQGEKGDGGDTKRSFSQAAGELNEQKTPVESSEEMTASQGAEILADAMDFMTISSRETASTSSSVSEGLLRWGASDPQSYDSRRNRTQRAQGGQSTSSCSSISRRHDRNPAQPQQAASMRSPTTSVAPAQDTSTESLSVAVGDHESAPDAQHDDEHTSDMNDHQTPNEQLELLRSLTVLMVRMEEKLTRVEAKVAQLEKHDSRPLNRSGSIGKALIAVTVPSYSATSEDFDAAPSSSSRHVSPEQTAAQFAHIRTATVFDGAVSLENSRRAFSLDVDTKQNLSHFHQHRSLQPSAHSSAIDSSLVNGREDASVLAQSHQGQRHSASFRLQPRRKSKSTLADQLWCKNSSPSQAD